METRNQCPRCGVGRMRAWSELSDEEREVVRRLPAAADYSLEVRQGTHRWCPRCWYEERSGVTQNA
jgi:ribosomal protein S27AE